MLANGDVRVLFYTQKCEYVCEKSERERERVSQVVGELLSWSVCTVQGDTEYVGNSHRNRNKIYILSCEYVIE